MKEKLKERKGITLIALIITIIVLLILASVSIAMLTGENGILNQANQAKEQNEIGKEKEMVNLAVTSLVGQGYTEGKNMLTSENLQKEMNEIAGKDKTSVTGTTILKVEFKETKREYYVNSEGKIIEPIDYTNIYTYTEDGYITGVKNEYLKNDTLATNKKYATTNNIQLALAEFEYYLIDELNGTLKIPNVINSTKIVGIAEEAFGYIRNLKEVIIEDGIETLGDFSFRNCYNLTNIELPNTLISIGANTFYYCQSIKEIIIPNSVREIGTNAFEWCTNLASIIIEKEKGSLTDEPWGAYNATITYVGDKLYWEFADKYLSNKNEIELEEIILQDDFYIGTFEEFLKEKGTTIEELKQEAQNSNITYVEYLKKKTIVECSEFINFEYGCSKLGLLDKSTQELEQIYVEKEKANGATEELGEFNTFDELLEKLGQTRQEFEQIYKEQGFRTEDVFLKMLIVQLENI